MWRQWGRGDGLGVGGEKVGWGGAEEGLGEGRVELER